jgi:hypothetical protein
MSDQQLLDHVATVTEIADLYCYDPASIQYHIDRGHFIARKTGKVWLISLPSVVKKLGPPKVLAYPHNTPATT